MSLGAPNAPHPGLIARKLGEGVHRHLTFWMISE